MQQHPLRIGSLFSGAGLCDLGFHKAGFKHEFFCEIDSFCKSILRRHWPDVPIYDDITSLNGTLVPEVDILVGGFPCQDVSCAGKRAGITLESRSGLWNEYKRIIKEKTPKYVVIENVKGLLSKGMEDVLQDLSSIGYDAEWQCISASAFGAPHLRERIFIVAYPHSSTCNQKLRVFTEERRQLDKHFKLGSVSDWLGIRIDRSRRKTLWQSYPVPSLYRVDDGCTTGLDTARGGKPYLPSVTRDDVKKWIPMLKALGNGVVPQQAYYVACCILIAEGLMEV